MVPGARSLNGGYFTLEAVPASVSGPPLEYNMTLIPKDWSLLGRVNFGQSRIATILDDLPRPAFFLLWVTYETYFACEVLLFLLIETLVTIVILNDVSLAIEMRALDIGAQGFNYPLIFAL